uniref:ADP-ribosylation factor-binding protein GGA3-like n=1 Tax=Sinocyclocheilus rhinocerous TaxID=307959 RepID=A0A673MST8_9TELE
MADPGGESLESWLNKATNPSNRQEEWEYIIGFCDQINKELEGPQISVRLLAHKIQSPQDWESLQALTEKINKCFNYLGDRVSERVKTKVIELLYSWSVALPDEAKIIEAYQMLKKQGIVAQDPVIPVDKTLIPSPKPKNPVFDNKEKTKRLAELLKSKKPEDLQEANRIIKNMVKEDVVLQQKVSHRVSILEEVNNSVKLPNEMLSHFKRDESTQEDKELLKDLYNDCDKLRTAVFRLATETDDDDSALGDILHASDDLSRVINSYKKIVEGQTIMIDLPGSTASERMYNVLEFSQSNYSSLGSRELRAGEENIHPALTTFSLPAGITPVPSALTSAKPQSFAPDSPLFRSLSPTWPTSQSPSGSDISLTSVFVQLEAIKPSKEGPVTAYDKDGVHVLHFATDHPLGRPDVLVIVVSMLNTAPLLVRNIVLQAAVPKSMRVKLQPPSGTEMTPFNPFMPPSSITQIMLLANPLKEKVRMRYKLTFILGDRQVTESGEIDKFPPVERWGHL